MFYQLSFYIFYYSAGLLGHAKSRSDEEKDPQIIFEQLRETIKDPKFNIMKTASEERICNSKYPLKMRTMQKLTVDRLTTSDPRRKKVQHIQYMCYDNISMDFFYHCDQSYNFSSLKTVVYNY